MPIQKTDVASATILSFSDSEDSIYNSAIEDEGGNNLQTAQEYKSWKEPLLNYIISNHLEDNNHFRVIESAIGELTMEGQIIDNKMDVFLQRLIDALKDKSGQNIQTKKNVNNKTSNKKAHNKRKRYTKHQELYKRCPRKLLDLALMGEPNNAAAVSLPKAELVGPLYSDQWDRTGPHNALKDI